ncbi:hypothetical protein [Mesorhizobium sp.]|uniref:hypothetical protein n=1 Tax=Mesorhizobium sp. TaxID=1871066 RepID=UPI0025796C05|nr:hypothetical protein [Mesorhizobium sp.]
MRDVATLCRSNWRSLSPGVYVIQGGDFKANSNAVISGEGVIIYLAGSSGVSMNGTATVKLSAPTSGTYSGVLFYGDRANLAGSNTFNGTADSLLTGALNIDGYQGGSNRNHMGRANLINPQLSYVDHHNIASSLVHEAIHIFLYKLEVWPKPSEDHDELYRPSRISPWTGQKIHLLAFIHASFVWYGLRNLWRDIEAASRMSQNPVGKYYIETATEGFNNPLYIRTIDDCRDVVNPILSEQLVALYRSI